jgi:hypothetical protein
LYFVVRCLCVLFRAPLQGRIDTARQPRLSVFNREVCRRLVQRQYITTVGDFTEFIGALDGHDLAEIDRTSSGTEKTLATESYPVGRSTLWVILGSSL